MLHVITWTRPSIPPSEPQKIEHAITAWDESPQRGYNGRYEYIKPLTVGNAQVHMTNNTSYLLIHATIDSAAPAAKQPVC